jgi:predicted metal-dependent HD superfamily phosphohydrolase
VQHSPFIIQFNRSLRILGLMGAHPTIIAETERFVFDLLKREQREGHVYHTVAHSEAVANTARRLAKALELGEEGIEIVTLAGWLHDVGYTEIYYGHEEVSIRIATEFLHSKQYPDDKIQLICGCIAATKVPQQPKNILEEIVADADLAGLARKSFFEQSELLRIEWDRALAKKYTDEEWIDQNIDLLSSHRFFTRVATELYEEQQAANLRKLYKRKQRLVVPNASDIVTPPEVAKPAQHSNDGFYVLLHSIAQRQIMSQYQLNIGAFYAILGAVVVIVFAVRPMMWVMHEESLQFIPLLMAFATAVATIILACRAYKYRGKYIDDRMGLERFEDFELRLLKLRDQREAADNTILIDCYELKRVSREKQKRTRLMMRVFMYGLLLSFVVHFIIHQLDHV